MFEGGRNPAFNFKRKVFMKMPTLTARTEFAVALNQICTERGISPEAVMETIKVAILAAYRKDKGLEEEVEYEVEVHPETGSAKIFKLKDKKKEEVTPPGFGRIAAQTAKQVILQKIRETEKAVILAEYEKKIGSIVNGMVLRFDGKDIVCDIGRGHGVMPFQEQVRAENYRLNNRLTLYILAIRETAKGRQVIVSRVAPELIAALFKREVPEVASGAVEIKRVAREAGNRAKVAVASKQAGVDPVGSCVGQKGVRVGAVIDELGGEKLDIVPYSDDPLKFVIAALSPAENLKVVLDEKKKIAVVTAPEDQLSLAIGKEGQNVRLAAKLTGYKIDIVGPKGKKESQKAQKKSKGTEKPDTAKTQKESKNAKKLKKPDKKKVTLKTQKKQK